MSLLFCIFANICMNYMFYKKGVSVRKAIALSFLFLANAILLVHAVVAHHHDGIPVALVAICHDHDCTSQHPDDADPLECNDPYCHGNIKDCSLSLLYANFEYDKKAFQSQDFNIELLFCILTLFTDNNAPLINDIGLPFRQNPYLQSYNTEYISQSLGLRAPPAC